MSYTGSGLDTLAGPVLSGETVRWLVNGAGTGELRGVGGTPNPDTHALQFSGIANLTGATGSTNAFVFGSGATLSGAVTGVAGGTDVLVFNGGTAGQLTAHATGPHAGTVALDGVTVAYTGIAQLVVLTAVTDGTLDTTSPPNPVSSATVSSLIGTLGLTYPAGVTGGSSLMAFTPNPAGSITAIALRAPSSSLTLNGTPVPVPNNTLLQISGLTNGILDFGPVTMGTTKTLTLSITNLILGIAGLTASLTSGSVFGISSPLSLSGLTAGLGLSMNAPNAQSSFSDVLHLGGTLLGNLFSLSIPIVGRATAWADNSGLVSLSPNFLGTVGGALNHTLQFNSDGSLALVGGSITDLFTPSASNPISSLSLTGASGAPNILKIVSDGPLPYDILYHGSTGGLDSLIGPAFSGSTALWSITGSGAGTLTGVSGGTTDAHKLTFDGVTSLVGAPASLNAFVLSAGASFTGTVDGGLGSLAKLVLNNGSSYGNLIATASSATSGHVEVHSTPSTIDYLNLQQLTVLTSGANAAITTPVGTTPSPLMQTTVGDRAGGLGLPLPLGLSDSSTLDLIGGAGVPSIAFLNPTTSLLINGVQAVLSATGLNALGQLDLGTVTMGATSSGSSFSLTNLFGSVISGLTATLASGGACNAFCIASGPDGTVGGNASTSSLITFAAPTTVDGLVTDTLNLDGLTGSTPFSLSIPLIGRSTAWLLDGSGNLTLSPDLLGNVLPGGVLNNTLSFGQDGSLSLLGAGLTGVLADLAPSLPGSGGAIIVNGASGAGLQNALSIVTGGAQLPFDIVYNGNSSGGDSLTGPGISGETTKWVVNGTGLSSLTGVVPGSSGGSPTPDPHGLSFSGVSSLLGAPGSTNAFLLDGVSGLTGVDGGLGSASSLLLNDGAITSITSLATGALSSTLNLVGGLLPTVLGLLNLNLSALLTPVPDVEIDGLVGLPDVFLLTSTNLGALVHGLGLPLPDTANLLLVGGTNASLSSLAFAPPTHSLTINGRGGLDVTGVVGDITMPGASLTIDSAIIAVLGVSTSVVGSVPALGTAVSSLVPIAPLAPLLGALSLLGSVSGSVAGTGGGLTTTLIDTRCASGPGGTCDSGVNGAVTLRGTGTGLLDELGGALPADFDLLPVDLAAAVVLVAGAQIAGGSVDIEATSIAHPAHASLPVLSASIATSIAQVIVLASTIQAVDTPAGSDPAITLASDSEVTGTTGGSTPLGGLDASVAATLVVSVAATTVVASQLLAADGTTPVGPVAVTADNTIDVHTLANAGSATVAGGAVAVTVAAQITAASLTLSDVHATGLEVRADATGTVETRATASPHGADQANGSLLTGAVNALANAVVGTVASTLQSVGAGGVAASLAVGGLLETTQAFVLGGTLDTTGDQLVHAGSATGLQTVADASAVSTGAGLAVGVAVSLPIVVTGAFLSATQHVHAPHVGVEAVTGGSFETDATSGAGAAGLGGSGPSVGLAGALAVGVNVISTTAHLLGTVTVDPGTDVAVSAATSPASTVNALAATGGVGPSVALNVLADVTLALLDPLSTVTGAHDLTLTAQSADSVDTLASAAVTGTGASSLPVSVATAGSIALVTTTASLTAGAALTLDGSLDVEAIQAPHVTTTATGGTGAGAAAGAVVALTVAVGVATATTLRDIDAAGDVTLHSISYVTAASSATASSAGASATPSLGVTDLLGNLTDLALTLAAASGLPLPELPPLTSTLASAGSPSAAAAIAATLAVGTSFALLPATVSISAGGRLSVLADGQVDSAAAATAAGVDSGASGVAAAVAVNLATVVILASADGAAIDTHGLSVQAGMAPGSVGGSGANHLSATATAGLATGSTGLAGAFAVSVGLVTSTAIVGNPARGPPLAFVSSDSVVVSALSITSNTAVAAQSAGGGGGAAIALAISTNLITATLAGAAIHATGAASGASTAVDPCTGATLGSGDVSLCVAGAAATTAAAESGASGGAGAIGGAVAIAAGVNILLANDLAPVVATGAVRIEALHTGTSTVSSADGLSYGPGVGLGAAVALTVAVDLVSALLVADVTAGHGVMVSAISAPTSHATANAGASGASPLGDETGSLLDSALALVNALAGAGTASLSLPSGTSLVSLGAAAALAADLSTAETVASIGPVTVQPGTGGLTVQALSAAQAGSDAGASASGAGAAVSLTLAVNSTEALLLAGATIAAGGEAVNVVATAAPQTVAQALPLGTGGSGIAVALAVAVNLTAAASSATVGAGSMTVHATGGGTTTAVAESTGGGTTLAAAAPALSLAFATNVTVAALLAGSVTTSGAVVVAADSVAATVSVARGLTTGPSLVTVAGPVAVSIALDITFATSVAPVSGDSLAVTATSANLSDAHSIAASAGVSGDGSTDGLLSGLTALTGIAPSVIGLLPDGVLAAGLPVPSVPALPSVAAPGVGGVLGLLGAAAAIAVNVEVSATLAAVPTGGVSVTGPLVVLASGYSVPGAHADATRATGGAATAVGVDLAIVSLVALLGGPVSANGVTVATLVVQSGVPVTTRPVAEAFAGAGGSTGVGAAGALALSVSVVASIAAILPGAVVQAGSGAVVVYADADTHAEANTDATVASGPVSNASAVAVGAAITLTVATNVTLAVLGGQVTTSGGVYVLAADAPAGAPAALITVARTPTYVTAASARAATIGSTLAVSPAVAVAIALNTTAAAVLPAASVTAGGQVVVLAAPDAQTTTFAAGSTSDATLTAAGPIALTVALDTTFATSLGTISAAGATVSATPAGDVSDALSVAGSGGKSSSAATSGGQVTAWLGALTGLTHSPLDAITGLLPNAGALLPSNLPVAAIPALPPIAAPDVGGGSLTLGAAAAIAINLEAATTLATVPLGGIAVSGPLVILASGFSQPGAHADATQASGGAATGVGVDVALISLVALLGGTVTAQGVTVETLVVQGGVQKITQPVAEAFAGAGDGTGAGVGVAGAFALSVSVVTSVAAILPGTVVQAGSSPVVVYADADTEAAANTDASVASGPVASPAVVGAGAAITLTIATNFTLAVLGGQIVTTGDVWVLAAAAPPGAPSALAAVARSPRYVTGAAAAAKVLGGTAAVAPAVAIAIAANTTVAAILPLAQIGSPGSPAGQVVVLAAPDAQTTSQASGSATDATATAAGPIALSAAIDTTLATSLGTITAAGASVTAAPVGDVSDAQAVAGVGGDGASAATTDGQTGAWLSSLLGLTSDPLGIVSGLVPGGAAALLPSNLPVPAIPALPSVSAPGTGGVLGALHAAAAIAVNLEVASTVAAVPLGGITVSGPLVVLASGFSQPGAHADATLATGGAATAAGVDVAVVSLVALLGGSVSAQGVTVETLVVQGGVQKITRPVAEAFAGAGSLSGAGAAGAFALSVSIVTSVAAILPGASVAAGSGPVVVYADADTRAQANTDASAAVDGVQNLAAVAAGAAITLTVATNTTIAALGGQVTTSGGVWVLASDAPAGAPAALISVARTPTYQTTATASAKTIGGTAAVAPAVAIAIAANTTVAAVLPLTTVSAGGQVVVLAAPDALTTTHASGSSADATLTAAGPDRADRRARHDARDQPRHDHRRQRDRHRRAGARRQRRVVGRRVGWHEPVGGDERRPDRRVAEPARGSDRYAAAGGHRPAAAGERAAALEPAGPVDPGAAADLRPERDRWHGHARRGGGDRSERRGLHHRRRRAGRRDHRLRPAARARDRLLRARRARRRDAIDQRRGHGRRRRRRDHQPRRGARRQRHLAGRDRRDARRPGRRAEDDDAGRRGVRRRRERNRRRCRRRGCVRAVGLGRHEPRRDPARRGRPRGQQPGRRLRGRRYARAGEHGRLGRHRLRAEHRRRRGRSRDHADRRHESHARRARRPDRHDRRGLRAGRRRTRDRAHRADRRGAHPDLSHRSQREGLDDRRDRRRRARRRRRGRREHDRRRDPARRDDRVGRRAGRRGVRARRAGCADDDRRAGNLERRDRDARRADRADGRARYDACDEPRHGHRRRPHGHDRPGRRPADEGRQRRARDGERRWRHARIDDRGLAGLDLGLAADRLAEDAARRRQRPAAERERAAAGQPPGAERAVAAAHRAARHGWQPGAALRGRRDRRQRRGHDDRREHPRRPGDDHRAARRLREGTRERDLRGRCVDGDPPGRLRDRAVIERRGREHHRARRRARADHRAERHGPRAHGRRRGQRRPDHDARHGDLRRGRQPVDRRGHRRRVRDQRRHRDLRRARHRRGDVHRRRRRARAGARADRQRGERRLPRQRADPHEPLERDARPRPVARVQHRDARDARLARGRDVQPRRERAHAAERHRRCERDAHRHLARARGRDLGRDRRRRDRAEPREQPDARDRDARGHRPARRAERARPGRDHRARHRDRADEGRRAGHDRARRRRRRDRRGRRDRRRACAARAQRDRDRQGHGRRVHERAEHLAGDRERQGRLRLQRRDRRQDRRAPAAGDAAGRVQPRPARAAVAGRARRRQHGAHDADRRAPAAR